MLLEDFYAEVLKELNVLAAEEAPTPSDRLAAKNRYEQVHAEYSVRDILPWLIAEAVPDKFAHNMAVIVADRLTNKFSVPQTRKSLLKTDAEDSLAAIISEGQRRATNHPATEFF